MSKGIKEEASKVGYSIEVYSSNNSNKTEIENLVKAINNKVDGIVLSPINSSNAVFLLKLAKDVNIPVVISDIEQMEENIYLISPQIMKKVHIDLEKF